LVELLLENPLVPGGSGPVETGSGSVETGSGPVETGLTIISFQIFINVIVNLMSYMHHLE